MVKELKLSTTWIGATELVMSSSYLKRTIICISPKNNLVSGKNFYHDVYGREYLKHIYLVIIYYKSHYQVEHWLGKNTMINLRDSVKYFIVNYVNLQGLSL